jgi:Uma2 family endonuclease
MQTHELVSVHEYLLTTYRPDCDYVGGRVIERHGGELAHSSVMARAGAAFYNREGRSGTWTLLSLRLRVAPTRIRVPDVCVFAGPKPVEQVPSRPPFICIEILSRDQSVSDMQERVQDFLAFGVPYVWILDPKSRQAWQCTPGEMRQVAELRTADPAILVPLDEIFA